MCHFYHWHEALKFEPRATEGGFVRERSVDGRVNCVWLNMFWTIHSHVGEGEEERKH